MACSPTVSAVSTSSAGLVWYDRSGRKGTPAVDGRSVDEFTLSPDDKKAAMEVREANGRAHIWILDLTTGIVSPLPTCDCLG